MFANSSQNFRILDTFEKQCFFLKKHGFWDQKKPYPGPFLKKALGRAFLQNFRPLRTICEHPIGYSQNPKYVVYDVCDDRKWQISWQIDVFRFRLPISVCPSIWNHMRDTYKTWERHLSDINPISSAWEIYINHVSYASYMWKDMKKSVWSYKRKRKTSIRPEICHFRSSQTS